MKNKTLWIAVGVVVAVLIAALLLLPGQKPPQTPGTTVQTAPTIPAATEPGAVPVETTLPELTTEPAGTRPTEPEQTQPADEEPEQTEPPIYEEPDETAPTAAVQPLFPVTLEDGRLTVQSIFQFSGMNPDAGFEWGDEIAGLQMTNTSGEYLYYAEITVILTDGTALTFQADDVPPGKTVMAFCLEHEPLKSVESCEELYGAAEFGTEDHLAADLVQISVSGTEITLKNVSGQDLTDLNVTCHGLLNDSYFGGTAYHYNVASLPAGGTAVVSAVDCILGMTEVVRVEIGS